MIQTSDLIGKAFKYGGRGPEFYDCYGLITECLKRCGKPIPPDFESPEDQEVIAAIMAKEKENGWVRNTGADKHKEGSILLFKILGQYSHVGFSLGGNYFIHSWQGSDMVIIERISLWNHRIEGFYEYIG